MTDIAEVGFVGFDVGFVILGHPDVKHTVTGHSFRVLSSYINISGPVLWACAI